MSVWKRWFGRRSDPSEASAATCPFCGRTAAQRVPAGSAYPVWECECSAIGSGSPIYPDLDEVADGLLTILGIHGKVSEPSVPAGGSGVVSMQPFDIPKSLRRLEEILQNHHFEVQTSTWLVSGRHIHSIWVRRMRA